MMSSVETASSASPPINPSSVSPSAHHHMIAGAAHAAATAHAASMMNPMMDPAQFSSALLAVRCVFGLFSDRFLVLFFVMSRFLNHFLVSIWRVTPFGLALGLGFWLS